MPTVKIPEEAFLPVYRHTIESDYNIEFFYGSRDSGKSRHIAQRLVLKCLTNSKFKCPLIRKVANTVKDSQWATIKEVVEDWKLDALFKFTVSPLEIKCVSGGKFIARGMDEPKKIKSITNPTDAWIEEGSDLEEDDWTIITTSLRSNDYQTQIWFSFNPDVMGAYEEFWLYKRYFSHTENLSFTRVITETLKDGSEASIKYRVTHSTFYDNPYCPPERKAIYEGLHGYDYTVYAEGRWGRRKTGGEFYKKFDYDRNSIATVMAPYDSSIALHISFDFNVNPYLTCTIWQLYGKKAVQIDEICLSSPRNTTEAVCKEFIYRYPDHSAGMFVYGDPSGKQEDTRTEKGFNDYIIIRRALAKYRPAERVASVAPPVVMRGNFINTIFEAGYMGVEIVISRKCVKSLNDYTFLKEASDGTKLKEKAKDPKTEVTYEKYGHTSDAADYLICEAFRHEFALYQKGGLKGGMTGGKSTRKNDY